jgi:hypothetical protein
MVKEKNIAANIILSIVTCGIYAWVWLSQMVDDVNTISGQEGTSGLKVVLFSIITCGIYLWVWLYKTGDVLDSVRKANGEAPNNQSLIYLVLAIFQLGIVSFALIQSEINRYATKTEE